MYESFQLLSTQKEVTKLQEELEIMQPLLAQAAQETQETMEQIKKDSVCHHFRYLIFNSCFVNLKFAFHMPSQLSRL